MQATTKEPQNLLLIDVCVFRKTRLIAPIIDAEAEQEKQRIAAARAQARKRRPVIIEEEIPGRF
jgi:hypothetical protein